MKINFTTKLKNFDGSETEKTVGHLIGCLLFGYGDANASTDKKYSAYKLMQRISQSEVECEISVEEASLIKEIVAKSMSAGAYGQIVDLLENNE